MAANAAKALRFGPRLKELRIHLCQKTPASQGVREFIETHYVPVKQSNPNFPILIRECSDIQPRVWARYEFGQESSSSLSNLSKDEVMKVVTQMATA
ncbi:NADH dehydrogenase [ubiquinone] 1 alpha subcomplex subunit 2-like [Crassostrea virginica]|uniref:NADH dehydrogenase [ubiquinone] 1 alpha subcomplex subunit 2 n=1 Tax=Crassostrea virginica TaxID=6565 RepID=A0A8B8D170_CRAVI|nr:NADH dehydrogenase [ubiquinone] 1 alpha subcomplex subunit 2-like [Crassostrea virginica]XP_022321892.1 NADH dehydrogenase [ubiquinone] 1 alpha subcomplex subunit 2-like [Crassostrea virginica]